MREGLRWFFRVTPSSGMFYLMGLGLLVALGVRAIT